MQVPAALVMQNGSMERLTGKEGQGGSLFLKVTNVVNLYGANIELAYDPALIKVLDDDPTSAGIQFQAAFAPRNSYIVTANADNKQGRLQLAFTLTYPTPAISGDALLASIRYQLKTDQNTASNAFHVVHAQLVDAAGRSIDTTKY